MEFRLRSGKNVEIVFWREKNGKVNAYPKDDIDLIEKEGTDLAKDFLIHLLKGYQLRDEISV